MSPWRNEAAEETASLLAYFQRISNMPADEIKREYGSVNQAFSRERSENQRLKLALLLSVPGAPFRDDARLLGLLDGSTSRTAQADSPQKDLATLLLRLTAERLRQTREFRDDQRRAENQNRDEQRKLELQVKDEQKRADDLQKKLDALLTIERELRQRSPQRGNLTK